LPALGSSRTRSTTRRSLRPRRSGWSSTASLRSLWSSGALPVAGRVWQNALEYGKLLPVKTFHP
jgi:hypothetical protein